MIRCLKLDQITLNNNEIKLHRSLLSLAETNTQQRAINAVFQTTDYAWRKENFDKNPIDVFQNIMDLFHGVFCNPQQLVEYLKPELTRGLENKDILKHVNFEKLVEEIVDDEKYCVVKDTSTPENYIYVIKKPVTKNFY